MPARLLATKPLNQTITIPASVSVEFTAIDLGNGSTVSVEYTVRNNAGLRVTQGTATKLNVAVAIDQTAVSHELRVERAQAGTAPSGDFVIEAIVRESNTERFRSTWVGSVASVAATAAADPALTGDPARGVSAAAISKAPSTPQSMKTAKTSAKKSAKESVRGTSKKTAQEARKKTAKKAAKKSEKGGAKKSVDKRATKTVKQPARTTSGGTSRRTTTSAKSGRSGPS